MSSLISVKPFPHRAFDHIESCACHKLISPLRLKSLASEKKKMGWAKESRLYTLVKPSIFPVEAFFGDLEGKVPLNCSWCFTAIRKQIGFEHLSGNVDFIKPFTHTALIQAQDS